MINYSEVRAGQQGGEHKEPGHGVMVISHQGI